MFIQNISIVVEFNINNVIILLAEEMINSKEVYHLKILLLDLMNDSVGEKF